MATMLVIDDDQEVRATLAAILQQASYPVVEARHGRAGLAAYQARPRAVVMTDLLMPEQEGLETILALRRLDPHVKILAMSGGGTRDVGIFWTWRGLWVRTGRYP